MDATQRLSYLRVALVMAGIACLALYPLMLIWPSYLRHGSSGSSAARDDRVAA